MSIGREIYLRNDTRDNDRYSASSGIEVLEHSGAEIMPLLNPKYLAEALKKAEGDVKIKYQREIDPLFITSESPISTIFMTMGKN